MMNFLIWSSVLYSAKLVSISHAADPGVSKLSREINSMRILTEFRTWKANCKEDQKKCEPPVADGTGNGNANFGFHRMEQVLKLATKPGNAQFDKAKISFQENGIPWEGSLSVFSIFPFEKQNTQPYVQIKIEFEKPIEVLCAESVCLKENMEIPPLICAGRDLNPSPLKVQRGATFKFDVQ